VAHAEGGTLFLDEVDALTPKAQIGLLRLLQDKTYRPVGSSIEQCANVRILSATNAPLDHLSRPGNFRADLYYRIKVFSIDLPPLRDRKEDIPALAEHFLQKHAPLGKPLLQLAPIARAALTCYEWPGNVRELESAITRGIHLAQGDSITTADLGIPDDPEKANSSTAAPPRQAGPLRTAKRAALEAFERDYLTRLMVEHRGNVSQAARMAEKDRRDFGKLLKKYHLDPRAFGRESRLSAS
jgi:DNA-binding NtrC family response regulator